MAQLQLITPCLWFDDQAEEAARFYCSLFPNSRIGEITHYTEAGKEIHGREPGSVLTVEFELDGQSFIALNGGPVFKFTEAVSFQIHCETQDEVDSYWEKLGGDARAQQCGWIKDQFGLSWQVAPRVLGEMMRDPDLQRRDRVMNAMLQMQKIDLPTLQRAYDG